jgi:A/G-specific adenine glycosylase
MSREADFARRLLAWFDRAGRHDLPWQHPTTPYRIWVAEIMLQQTQVATVIPYFQRFMQRFPDPVALADAPIDDVLAAWAGLGYYARARNLHAAAVRLRNDHDGRLPGDYDALLALPGIGRSTAGAVLVQAFDQPYAILDGNVKRVLARYHAVQGWPGRAAVARRLWALAEAHTPESRVANYTQAIMDLGATVCVRGQPLCGQCPLQSDCAAHVRGAESDYPEARPRRKRPLKRTRMLLLEDSHGRIMLQRRPPAGIWGGLWSLPEIDVDADSAICCRNQFGLEVSSLETWPVLRHGFTHFELEITPERARVRAAEDGVMEDGAYIWYKPGDENQAGVPAPVHRLLQRAVANHIVPSD